MEILFMLVPIALLLVVVIIVLMAWAINNGQYDDVVSPGHAILLDDDTPEKPVSSTQPPHP